MITFQKNQMWGLVLGILLFGWNSYSQEPTVRQQEVQKKVELISEKMNLSYDLIMVDLDDYSHRLAHALAQGKKCWTDMCRRRSALEAHRYAGLRVWLYERFARASFVWKPDGVLISPSWRSVLEEQNNKFFLMMTQARLQLSFLRNQVGPASKSSKPFEDWAESLLVRVEMESESYMGFVEENLTVLIKASSSL